MNCLEFRRRLAAEPGSTADAFLAHRDACPRCAESWSRAQAFEATLTRALAVPVPEGLADRILLRQTTAVRQARADTRRVVFQRLAAAVVLGAGLSLVWRHGIAPAQALPDLAVEHLEHEPYALSARAEVDPAQIEAAFVHLGVRLAARPDAVNYLQNCDLGEHRAVHMVVQRAEGPVTVLFVAVAPERTREVFERDGLKGRAVAMGTGTLVLLASHDAGFDSLEARWRTPLAGAVTPALAAR